MVNKVIAIIGLGYGSLPLAVEFGMIKKSAFSYNYNC